MKLLVLDVEGTVFKATVRLPGTEIDSTIWQGIAKSLGEKAILEEIETHRKWKRNEYNSYLEWMEDTIEIHKRYGLSQNTFDKLINSAEYNDHVLETILCLQKLGYIPVLISGGFRSLATRAQRDIGIIHAFTACEYFFDSSGYLCGYNLLPCDFKGKFSFVKLLLSEYSLKDDDWVFIGDGANDVHIAKEAPLSIAFGNDQVLSEASTHSTSRFSDVIAILGDV